MRIGENGQRAMAPLSACKAIVSMPSRLAHLGAQFPGAQGRPGPGGRPRSSHRTSTCSTDSDCSTWG
eukprot:139739-Pyramimonas_sp.AAC.1